MSFCLKKCICLPPSLCYSVFKTIPSVTSVPLLLCPQNYPVSLCHYVILSKKVHLSPPVPLLFCLQDHPFCYLCPPVTLSSKLPCLLCHYVILSKKVHLSRPVPLLFCLQNHHFCYSCPPVTLSSKLPCLPLSLCHYV